MEDLSNGWADIAAFHSDDLAAFDLTALVAEPRMVFPQSYSPSPPHAPPQISPPQSTNVPAGTYESTAKFS